MAWASTAKPDEDDVLRIDSFPPLQKVLWGSLVRTAVKYIGIGVMGGRAMGALVYYIQNGRDVSCRSRQES